MPLKVPNLPIYPYVQKNTLYKVNIHSNVQAIFTKLPFKQKILYLVIIWVVFLSFLVHIQASLYVCLVICSNNGAYAPFKISSYGPITMRLCGEHGWSHLEIEGEKEKGESYGSNSIILSVTGRKYQMMTQ